jgi:hypothetical protein
MSMSDSKEAENKKLAAFINMTNLIPSMLYNKPATTGPMKLDMDAICCTRLFALTSEELSTT